jgi:hypothetical protein
VSYHPVLLYRITVLKCSSPSLYIVACSIACSRLILHLKESSRQALYRNKDMPTSWKPSFDFEASVPSLGLRRSGMMFGFGSERVTPPSGISGSFEEIDMIDRDRGGQRSVLEISVELSSMRSTPSPRALSTPSLDE